MQFKLFFVKYCRRDTRGCVVGSVTRLGDLLHFGQLFKACGNN